MNSTEQHSAELNHRIDAIFVNLFELDQSQLSHEKNIFTDLGLDSLDTIDLIISFHKEFGIKPPNEELQHIKTLADVYALVSKYHSSRQQDSDH